MLIWNCRGLNNLDYQVISFFSSISNVDFIFLSELKARLQAWTNFFKLGFPGCTRVDADNNSGGLFLSWSRRVVVSILATTKNVICCKTSDMASNSYYVAFVYGSPNLSDRQVWNNLNSLLAEY